MKATEGAVTARELRQHLAAAHGFATRGWGWAELTEAHQQFHDGQGSPPPFTAAGGDGPGHVDDSQGVDENGSTGPGQGPAGCGITPEVPPDSSAESAVALSTECSGYAK